MDTMNEIGSLGGKGPEDALKVLGRVADAFDNPGPFHKPDKEVLFVVNVVKSRHLLASLSSEESVCQNTTYGSHDSSFDSSCDEDVEVVELGDVSKWEHASSYPYAPRRHQSRRSFSERVFRQDDGMYDVTKMLLTSSPLDRLDRLARMELKKTGWFERTDKWSVVQLGLQGVPLPMTSPKTPSKSASEGRARSSASPSDEKHASRSAWRSRYGHDISECNQGDRAKYSRPSPDLADFSTLSYVPESRLSHKTPVRTLRLPQQQTRGKLGQAVRNLVKKMLPPERTRPAELTPRSDVSGESRWTFGSGGSWMETGNRWSGLWH